MATDQVYYAIRHKLTGHFMPGYHSRRSRGGFTRDTPRPLEQVQPRLFESPGRARAALTWWAKGRVYTITNGGEDDWDESWYCEPDSTRDVTEFEIVKVTLTIEP